MFKNIPRAARLSTVGHLPLQEEPLYSTPEEFLDSITQKINVFESIYKCINAYVLPVTSIEDEYVVVVFEIMGDKLKKFYGGKYLIQQWQKKQKIFQAVHNDKPNNFFLTQQRFIYSLQGTSEESKFLYVTNFYQSVYQKINHPFYDEENTNGIHDASVYVDPKQILVVKDKKIFWAQLKIESILTMSPSNMKLLHEQRKSQKKQEAQYLKSPHLMRNDTIQEEIPASQTIEMQVEFIDVIANSSCEVDGLLDDLKAVHSVSNEGYLKKEIHFVVETPLKIIVINMILSKNATSSGDGQTFELKSNLQIEKQFAEIGLSEKLRSITLLNYADAENLLVIMKESGEVKMMSRDIMQMMLDYQKSVKQANDDDDDDDDEEEKRRLAELAERQRKFCYRLTKMCKRGDDDAEMSMSFFGRKNKRNQAPGQQQNQTKSGTDNGALNQIKNFFARELKISFFEVSNIFIRRQQIYFEGANGEIKRINISQIKNTDAITPSSNINNLLEVALLQDLTMHINTFNDFIIANTTLIISHAKLLSIYDFLTKQWTHMLPGEQGNLDQGSQTYFGEPDDEIDQLLLNYIFSNSIYDCIIMYKGKFIRRLKYYNNLDRTFFEKTKLFEKQDVLQIQRNVDTRNYRQYGDSTIRTLFMIEDRAMNYHQIWVSENGGRITKLVDQIPIDYEWQLIDIPNARSDYLIIYAKKERSINIYSISNSRQCLFPGQLQKYQIQKLENIDYDPNDKVQYFLFQDKLFYQYDGNLMVLHLKNKKDALQMINFNKTIKELFMTHEESVYYKDKNNIFRFAQLELQHEFNIDTQPSEVFNCRGAFCTKLEYSITTNRIALFTSSFEISLVPLLDRYRIDLMASQDFETNFICWKEIDNRLIALKKPNILVTWNTDTGKIINYHKLHGYNFNNYARHSEWDGKFLIKKQKELSMTSTQKTVPKPKSVEDSEKYSDDSYDFDNQSEEQNEDNEDALLFSEKNPNNVLYTLVEIKSPYELVQHCQVAYESKAGVNLYISFPYLLVMDETCSKFFLLQNNSSFVEGGSLPADQRNNNGLKIPRLMHTFYEPQMKIGKPLYFSPDFHHRIFIDPTTKEVVLNFTLTNVNIYRTDIRKNLMFQIEKTHPMIYFHDNQHITYLTNMGVERLFTFKTTVATKKRKATCELSETANIYYNEKSFLRRFMLDPLSFNPNQASQMESEDILKFRGDVLKRYLHLDVYKTIQSDKKKYDISRFLRDKNISLFTHFIINNYRQQLTFNYLNWKVLNQIADKKIQIKDLTPIFISELSYTVLPHNKNIYHLIGQDFEVLDTYIKYVNNENIEEEMQEEIALTDVLFIPSLDGRTPLHESVDTNNTRVTDRFVQALMITDFDHHSRFILGIYPELIAQVPQSMSSYLDARLKIPQWISEYTRGRIEAGDDCDFVMTADKMWSETLDESLQGKMYQPEVLEVPLSMQILDLPHLHKYENDIADEFLEALADTECIEIFSNKSIQALIEIKWPLVKQGIKKWLFYPYLIFLIAFLYYTVVIFEDVAKQKALDNSTKNITNDSNGTISAFDTSMIFNFIDTDEAAATSEEKQNEKALQKLWIEYEKRQKTIVKVVVTLLTLYFFSLEVRQMFVQSFGKYLGSPWNYLDIIPLVLITISMSFENLGIPDDYERPCNAVACFFMWIKFLYFWRIFRQTSKFISMIVAIISDLRVFMIVFLVTLTAFGNSMYIMSNNNPEVPKEGDKGRFIHSLGDSVFFAYRMSLGDFDTEDLGTAYKILAVLTFVVATLFLTIMMLNILIAVISDSYARVESTSIEEMYKNFADLIAENEYLVYKRKLEEHDQMGDYLYIAKVDKNDDDAVDAWETKLNNVKQQMIKKTENIENMLKLSHVSLVDNLHTQTDLFISLMKDANTKYDQKLQFVMRKMEQSGMAKSARRDSQSSISGFGGADNKSPEQPKQSAFAGGLGGLTSMFGKKGGDKAQ